MTGVAPQPEEASPAPVPLTAPRDGLVPVIDRIQPLLAWCERAAAAPEEPVAVDAERASSYRYSSRAYLVQLRTEAAGTALVDPLAFTLPGTLKTLLAEREWVLHAAGQDLPSLAELGLVPGALFDTELAARLLGMARVGLGAVVEDTLGLSLAKEHSAADWSQRPLPESWLVYAALDVEVLVEVRHVLENRLREAGKLEWAAQEFERERTLEHGPTRSSSWRGLHGIGGLRSARQLAAARAMWTRRDEIAAREDLSPHRVIKDRDIVAGAKEAPRGRDAFDKALPAPLPKKDARWHPARAPARAGGGLLPAAPQAVGEEASGGLGAVPAAAPGDRGARRGAARPHREPAAARCAAHVGVGARGRAVGRADRRSAARARRPALAGRRGRAGAGASAPRGGLSPLSPARAAP